MESVDRAICYFHKLLSNDRIRSIVTFFFVWTFLPNFVFVAIWVTGGPIRTPTIVLYLLIGLAALRLPLIVVFFLYLAVLSLDVVWLISGLFNLSPVSTVYAVKYLSVIDPFSSFTYAAFVIAIVASMVAVFWFAKRLRPHWRAVSLSGACLGVLIVMSADVALNLTPEYRWGRFFRAMAPFDSAMRNSGLAQRDLAGGHRDLFVVMVESWGELVDPTQRELILSPLMREGVEQRYAVTRGESDYYGSTTSAEFRELCGRWAEFADYIAEPAPDCLPARLSAAGYETIAFHGFTGRMFDRNLWYPNIGFHEIHFREQLDQEGLRTCGGVFAGICDVDLSRLVERALVDTDGRPRLVYWLTLNSHLPVDPDIDFKFLHCDGAGDPFADQRVCQLADQWMQVMDKVADILENAKLHPLDVLIVGDHAPPFWTRAEKAFFVQGKVPWILLRSKDRADQTAEAVN